MEIELQECPEKETDGVSYVHVERGNVAKLHFDDAVGEEEYHQEVQRDADDEEAAERLVEDDHMSLKPDMPLDPVGDT